MQFSQLTYFRAKHFEKHIDNALGRTHRRRQFQRFATTNMTKRKRVDDNGQRLQSKRVRSDLFCQLELSKLSDELVLKILTYLPVADLAVVQRFVNYSFRQCTSLTPYRVSTRLKRLAGDSELWKQKYYARWVRPRVLRIPGLKDTDSPTGAPRYSSKLAKWLDQGHLIQRGMETDWKRQYRLRYNWWRGSCKVRELELEVVAPPVPPILVKFHQGIIYTLDAETGLRAWTARSQSLALATRSLTSLSSPRAIPTALGLDVTLEKANRYQVSVGLDDGSFHLYTFELASNSFQFKYSHPSSSNGAITAIATAGPYVLTMSLEKILSLYQFSTSEAKTAEHIFDHPQLLASLRSDMAYTPLSLSIRTSSVGIVACVAYAFSRLNLGWAVGLQELRLTREGETLGSRLTSTAEVGSTSFQSIKDQHSSVLTRSAASQPFALHPQSMARPTSLSYSHPYLLASLPDNTLMIYLVTSDAEKLTITTGRRLWGHTSSVSGAEVSGRGKAVSVSTKGNEIRVWELEEVITSTSNRKPSVQITPERQDLAFVAGAIARRGDGLGLALHDMQRELAFTRSWVGFDDEQVVVLGERCRRQILSCYDFT